MLVSFSVLSTNNVKTSLRISVECAVETDFERISRGEARKNVGGQNFSFSCYNAVIAYRCFYQDYIVRGCDGVSHKSYLIPVMFF